MSILLIGQKSPANYRSPFFANNQEEINFVRRDRKQKQEQYRLELF